MKNQPTTRHTCVEWGVASRICAGQTISGDTHLVQPTSHGVLVALVDGVGHGAEAVTAADLAREILKMHADEPVIDLVQRCHEELKDTRGAVMTLASFHAEQDTLCWLGVGNVEGCLIRPGADPIRGLNRLLLRAGLVGLQLPALYEGNLKIRRGDLLILASDGVRAEFVDHLATVRSPQQMADWILSEFDKGTDDAMIVVARYLGGEHE